jgi:DNA sulfur modification protein DndE
VQAAQEKIMSHYYHAGRQVNGWRITTNTGDYGDDYIQRALMTEIGLGANLPEDAVYPMAKFDKDGTPLNGTNKYVMHFKKDKLPPVNGFWSLTMYNDQYFFVNNPINRYSISLRDNLKYNADGSLDIYIQHDSPGADKESNWLPAPQEVFILMMRLYWPKEAAISGSWVPPGVRKQ